MPAGVEIDTTKLERFARRLASGLDAGGSRTAREQADRTANEIRSTVPRRTGRLANSVAVVAATGGSAVTYGTGVPYARYIERRTGAVAAATRAGSTAYRARMIALARREVRHA